MSDVNWWLMALSFVLGLVLTLAFMIRRVTREVPVYAALGRRPQADAVGLKGDLKTDVEDTTQRLDVKDAGLAAGGAAAGAAAGAGFTDVDTDDTTRLDVKGAGLAAGAVAAGGAAAAKLGGGTGDADLDEPYGAGSRRIASGVAVPSGYTIKGNEDSMLYHTPDSPSYEQTIAELWFIDEVTAEKAGFRRWDSGGGGTSSGAAELADIPPGPYGVGSAKAGSAGSGPGGWLIKGNEDSMLYHTTESPSYEETIAEIWFVDEETAVKAGFTPWHKGKK